MNREWFNLKLLRWVFGSFGSRVFSLEWNLKTVITLVRFLDGKHVHFAKASIVFFYIVMEHCKHECSKEDMGLLRGFLGFFLERISMWM